MPGRFAPFVAKAVQAAAVHARGCGEEDVNAREHALQLMEACVPLCAPGEPAAATVRGMGWVAVGVAVGVGVGVAVGAAVGVAVGLSLRW